MTISHSIPSTTRKPGQFHEIDLLSGAQGLTPLALRVLLFGTKSAAGTGTANLFEQIFDEAGGDAYAGQGSELALMIRKALETGRLIGIQPEIWAVPLADPAGTAAGFKITVTAGSAAAAGDIVFRVAGRTLRAGVSSGDNQDAVALAIKAAIDEKLAVLPVTAVINGVNANEVDLTAVCTGVNGNDITVTVEDVGLTALTVTPTAPTAGVGVVDLTTALANSLAKYFETKAIANHAAQDVTDLLAHQASAWAPAAKRWNFCFLAERGTLATANARAAAANKEHITVVAYEGSPSLPGEIAAATAVAVSARALPNYNWDGQALPLYVPADSLVFTDAEIESALAAGSTPLAPNDARDATEIVRLITTKTTEGGNPFENAKDLAAIRGLVHVIRQMDATFSQQFKAVNKSAQVLKRMRSVAFRVLRLFEELGVTQNVTALFPQLLVETDAVVPSRAVISLPESIVPNLHQIVFKHVLFVE